MQKYEVEGHEPSFLPDGKKWKQVWSDEFDGERLDTDKWSFRLNYWGYPAEQYTDKGVSLDGNGCVVFRPVVENGAPEQIPDGVAEEGEAGKEIIRNREWKM